VAAQVGTDERTERDELEPAGAEVGQGAGDQPLAQSLAFEGGGDLGVGQDHHAWLGPVLAVVLENARRFVSGQPLVNVVDKANWF
jgi:hypothetical protein